MQETIEQQERLIHDLRGPRDVAECWTLTTGERVLRFAGSTWYDRPSEEASMIAKALEEHPQLRELPVVEARLFHREPPNFVLAADDSFPSPDVEVRSVLATKELVMVGAKR
jgi:hypothetical protein